jgi:undecaprenyl-diphosphatase
MKTHRSDHFDAARDLSSGGVRKELHATGALFLGVIATLTAGVLFLLLARGVAHGAFDRLDHGILVWVRAHRTPLLNNIFGGLTSLGSGYVLAPMTLGACVALWLGGRPGMAVALAVAMIGAGLIDDGLKALVHRPRPEFGLRMVPAAVFGYAFPSGHTTSSFTFFVTLALLIAGHVQNGTLRTFLVLYALAMGGLVAVSRVYLGVHYPSDVLGGFLVGVAWSIAITIAEHLWRHRGARFVPSSS